MQACNYILAGLLSSSTDSLPAAIELVHNFRLFAVITSLETRRQDLRGKQRRTCHFLRISKFSTTCEFLINSYHL